MAETTLTNKTIPAIKNPIETLVGDKIDPKEIVKPPKHGLESTILQGRNLTISLGKKSESGIRIEGLHMQVSIKRTLEGGDLDSAKVTIINANKPCLDLVMKNNEPVYAQINAWYTSIGNQEKNKHTFLGEIVPPITFTHENFVDTHLKFTVLDGFDILTQKKYSGSFPAETSYLTILEDILAKSTVPVKKSADIAGGAAQSALASIMPIKLPSLLKKVAPLTSKLHPSAISKAVREKLSKLKNKSAWVESGTFTDVLDIFCKTHQLKWTVQNGIVRIVLKKDRFQYNYYKLDQNTMVEPMVEEKSSSSTLVLYRCKSMFLADVLPGDYIAVLNSRYLVVEVSHLLSNFGDDYHTHLTMEELEGGYAIKADEKPRILSQAESNKLKDEQAEKLQKAKELAKLSRQKAMQVRS